MSDDAWKTADAFTEDDRQENIDRIHWMNKIRKTVSLALLAATIAALAFLLISRSTRILFVTRENLPALLVIELIELVNTPYGFILRRIKNLRRFGFGQATLDIVLIVCLTYYLGGIDFSLSVAVFSFAIAFVGIVLGGRSSYWLAVVSSVGYAFIVECQALAIIPSVRTAQWQVSLTEQGIVVVAHVLVFFLMAYFGTDIMRMYTSKRDAAKRVAVSLAKLEGAHRELMDSTLRLAQTEKRLREAQRLGRIGHWEFDIEAQQIHWSDVVFTIYGRDPQLGPPAVEEEAAYYSAEDARRLRDCSSRTVETGEPYEVDVSVNLPGKRVTNVVVTGSAVKDDGGRTVRLLGTIQDITARKRMQETLENNEQRFRSLVETTSDWVWEVDRRDCYTYASPKIKDLLGYEPEEVIGKTMFDLMSTEEARRVAVEFQRAVESLNPIERLENVCLHRHGRLVVFETSAVPVLDGDAQYRGYRGISRDITERKRADAEHEKLQEQLRASQKMESIGRLAGGVAHDFNNMLSVILSYTGFVVDDVREGDPMRDDLMEVKKAADRAVALTRQLLAFSRKQVLQPVPLNLNQVASGIEKMLRRILGEDIEFIQVLGSDLGLTLADPGQIEQVLMNLVVNARDAMPEGGKLTVETSNVEIDEEYAASHAGVKAGHYVQLAITDNGCGMDEQSKARIFEPFFTTKEKSKGTGLGLSTAYGIVKQSGGHIWVYSEVGKGTTFKVHLPREIAATTATFIKPPTVLSRSTGTETILVVEDEEALRKVAIRALNAAGYTVLTAADGEEALLTCARHVGDIHLLLTDVVMPRMSGRVLAQELAKTRPALKVVYMSGYTDNSIIHHGVLDAGTHFLAKPFTSADLVAKLREVLDDGITSLADGHGQAANAGAEKKEQPLDKNALRTISPDILGRLHKAVIAARYNEMIKIVETIRIMEPDLAAGLRRMADRFDYDGMRDLLSQ